MFSKQLRVFPVIMICLPAVIALLMLVTGCGKKETVPGTSVEMIDNPERLTSLDKFPEKISIPDPEYPAEELKNKIEGDVYVGALIGEDGTVKETKIVKSSGNENFDQVALEAAWKAEFKPAVTVEGKPVEMWVSWAVSFSMEERNHLF